MCTYLLCKHVYCVCMCVCLCVCICVRLCVYVRARVCASVYASVHMSECTQYNIQHVADVHAYKNI